MSKEKSNAENRLVRRIISHPWLKVISLLLAMLLWLYVRDNIGRGG